VQSFLDVTLPPLLLAVFGVFLCALAAVLAVARLRLWAARRNRLAGARPALEVAADVLSAVIADPDTGAEFRDRALTAYTAVTTVITKENDNQ
jgi:hypothetical protein